MLVIDGDGRVSVTAGGAEQPRHVVVVMPTCTKTGEFGFTHGTKRAFRDSQGGVKPALRDSTSQLARG